MYDVLRLSLCLGIAGLIIAVASLGYFTWQSTESRNLALATATLAGATILFLVQLRFELRPKQTETFISAEFTIDRAKPEITQWKYDSKRLHRANEISPQSDAFAAKHPGQFDEDREKLTSDAMIASLLDYLATYQSDWKATPKTFISQTTGKRLSFWQREYRECTTISKDQLRRCYGHREITSSMEIS